jgi:membrane associated rhomboid family serine protease
MAGAGDREPPDDRDWIDRATTVAGWLGLNQVRVRWKLEAWRGRWRQRREAAQTRLEHTRYRHQSCSQCGGLVDGAERTCPHCGASLPAAPSRVVRRIGLVLPGAVSVSTMLALAVLGIHLRLMLADGGSPLGSFRVETLVRFGAHWPPLVAAGEWWRLGTACFLHVGLWHILFNLLALSQIGPAVEEVFGRLRMLLLFVVTGVAGNLASEALGLVAVSAGASGGLMGLIGAAAGWGQRSGTEAGREVRNRMVLWGLYTLGFGLFVGADNGAHAGGFVAGAVLGFLLPARWNVPRGARPFLAALDFAGLLAAGACVFLALVPPAMPEGRATGEQAGATDLGADFETEARRYYGGHVEVCGLRDAGKTDEALARLRALRPGAGSASATVDMRLLDAFCAGLDDLRRRCREYPTAGLAVFAEDAEDYARLSETERRLAERQYAVLCEVVGP